MLKVLMQGAVGDRNSPLRDNSTEMGGALNAGTRKQVESTTPFPSRKKVVGRPLVVPRTEVSGEGEPGGGRQTAMGRESRTVEPTTTDNVGGIELRQPQPVKVHLLAMPLLTEQHYRWMPSLGLTLDTPSSISWTQSTWSQ